MPVGIEDAGILKIILKCTIVRHTEWLEHSGGVNQHIQNSNSTSDGGDV
jgi:hypothetical protein